MSQIIIDDQDLTRVKYNGTWLRGGSPNEHDGTVASSTKVNDSFTVSFTGNSIAVYGTYDSTSGGVLTNYSVDGVSPAQATSQAGSADTYNQQFWKSPVLNEGDHKLVVTMAKVNSESQPGEGTIWFDYFLVIDPRIQSNSTARSKNIGAIVGGVIGGIVVLIFICLAIIFLLRRNKRRVNHVEPWTDKEIALKTSSPENIRRGASSHLTIQPFPPGVEENRIPNTATTPTSAISRKMASQLQIPVHPSSASAITTTTHQPYSPTVSSSRPPSSITIPPTPKPASRTRPGGSVPTTGTLVVLESSSSLPESAIQHVDSGVRVANLDPIQIPSAPVELPPVYSPV